MVWWTIINQAVVHIIVIIARSITYILFVNDTSFLTSYLR